MKRRRCPFCGVTISLTERLCREHTISEAISVQVTRVLYPHRPLPDSRRCALEGCAKPPKPGQQYCYLHKLPCRAEGCGGRTNGMYCDRCRARQLAGRVKRKYTRRLEG